MMIRRIAVSLVLCCMTAVAVAQENVPTPAEFLGYEPGERFTTHDRVLAYFNELARRSPLLTLSTIGETYEGRPLVLATITSAKNRAALDSIRANVAALAAGDVDAARAASIAKDAPAVAWLAFGIHGNESSSTEAAMKVASMLLHDADARRLLDDLVVIIDPLENPDGRERYVQWYKRTRGVTPNPNEEASEHAEPWPGGRYNHYLIDMNRDWAWASQKETRARLDAYRQWNPQVFVDFHEMGAQSSYFFPPDAKPINANLPADIEKWLEVFGRANAEAFSKNGWPFFVAERFDLFYPGYGDSWPSLHGAIGMTYEVAGGGRAGLAFQREDGGLLTLSHRADEHTTTAMASLRTAAANREQLLKYSYEAARSQIDAAKNTYLILEGSPNFGVLVEALQRQNVVVSELGAPVTVRATAIGGSAAENRTFPAGTAVVTTKQATGRLVETLLERSAVFTKGFLEAQRTLTAADEPDQFYDLTSWSMPIAMNVEAFVTTAPLQSLRPYVRPSVAQFRAGSYGYVIDGSDPNVYRAAGAMLAASMPFSVSEETIEIGGRTFARGSLVVMKNSRSDLDAALERVARGTGAAVTPLQSGWTGETALGSERIRYVRNPQIALVGGSGIDPSSYGMLWHTLDVDTPIPHTTVSIDSLRTIDLAHYRVLVLPDGDAYADRLGRKNIEKLQTWVRGGGTLIAIKDAAKFLREKDVEMSKLKNWDAPKKKEDDTPPEEERYNDFRVPGSAFRTVMNERSYLTFGVPRPPAVLIEGSAAFKPLTHKSDNVVTIETANPLVSGVAWPESLERLKGSPYLIVEPYGRGSVITFADQPNFRLFWRGTLPLFLNAVLYSPSFPR